MAMMLAPLAADAVAATRQRIPDRDLWNVDLGLVLAEPGGEHLRARTIGHVFDFSAAVPSCGSDQQHDHVFEIFWIGRQQ